VAYLLVSPSKFDVIPLHKALAKEGTYCESFINAQGLSFTTWEWVSIVA
jgi:hypothetical protein